MPAVFLSQVDLVNLITRPRSRIAPSRRGRNRGASPRLALAIRRSVGVLVFVQTRHGALGFRQATAHIFGLRRRAHYHADATLGIIVSLFSGMTSVSHVITCKYGRNFMRHAFKFRA